MGGEAAELAQDLPGFFRGKETANIRDGKNHEAEKKKYLQRIIDKKVQTFAQTGVNTDTKNVFYQ
ncbi:hypothetical protein KKC1_17700 [Calderihabitans maritimus]|uniref:Uncharacterized protein n=1 Tax=Calderihabitans maritimus TaxID=1246530 RepID=A0A1Z5HSW0_9FIRM|nr:hypothetical protein KKC1_17700 [Calderihabitans maritimus]